MPVTILALWLLAATGWGVILAGLRRGPCGRPALIAHTLTAPGVVLLCAIIGFGSLHGTIALTAEWWSLALVTGFRPERLIRYGTLPRLAAWAALTTAMVLAATHAVFHV
ncbi:hypothetical protein [Actinomadura sp. 9N407]|uniref:hypothetical protein n=1 Tax=Actinomadura sp. 9N407 TaxID=3375154 RepID=UPI0037A36B0D